MNSWQRLIQDPRLPLTRLTAFEDAFECLAPWFVWMARQDSASKPAGPKLPMLLEQAKVQSMNYASCWHWDEHESIAMWELYVGRSACVPMPGVAICILYEDLQNLIGTQARLGPVHYMRHDDTGIDDLTDSPDFWPFTKLWGYRHEKEFRVVIPSDSDLVDRVPGHGVWAHLKESSLLESLTLIRVFAANKAEQEQLMESVSTSIDARIPVARSTAYPKHYRYTSEGWVIAGLEGPGTGNGDLWTDTGI